jgi:hypothetical protein
MKNRDTQQLKKIDSKRKFKHTQHTEEFNKELHTPNQNVITPFRITDDIWLLGKYKGYKLDTIPVSYLEWVLKNFNNLSKTHKILIQQKVSNI